MSSETFHVGEIAIIVSDVDAPYIGSDVQVDGPLAIYPCRHRFTGELVTELVYPVRIVAMGTAGFAFPRSLRKKRPPQDWVKLCHLHDVPQKEPA